MAAIKSKNTKPELLVRRALHKKGLRFRLHREDLPGKPDLVFPSRRVAVFVHGCFWHAHDGCRYFRLPGTNEQHWRQKLEGNRARDERDQHMLSSLGWRVIVVWECELKKDPENCISGLEEKIRHTKQR